MDNALKKTDITKRILETRKQTEELKAQLQNLIDSGINSSVDYKTSSHSHVDKENVKESQNRVQIIKSYDTAHSQHVTKPGTSRGNLSERNKDAETKDQENVCKRTKNYDVNKAREYIKKQREKRLEEQKLKDEEKKKAELRKQKLEELRKKSLELVTKNVQTKRERSKSRERTDFVRPVKDLTQEKGKDRLETRNRKRSTSTDRTKNFPQEKVDSINPNLLYPPIPNYMLHMRSEKKSGSSTKKSPATHNKITIISGNSSDRNVETPESNRKCNMKALQPKNLFDTPKDGKEKSAKKVTKFEDQFPQLDKISGDSNQNFVPVKNLLEYKNIQNNNNGDINENLVPTNVEKPKLSEIGIGTDNLEKITKETQTKDESKHDIPLFLQKNIFEPDPLNFINCVRLKLQNAINTPTRVDVGVQSSLAQQNLKPESAANKEIKETLHNITRSSKKSDLKSFISHKCLNLDQKTIDNIELIPKNFHNKNSDTESDSDTSKNIPEISSESATSLKQNAESLHNHGIGLDVEKLNSMKLKAQNVNKDTSAVKSLEKPKNHSSKTNGESIATKLDTPNSKTETIRSSSKKLHTGDRYSSDFYSKSHSGSRDGKINFSNKNTDYEIITDPQIKLYSERHSGNIPQSTERHSKNTSPSMSMNSENENHISSRNITVRSVSHNDNLKSCSSIKESIDGVSDSSRSKKVVSNIPSESQTQTNKDRSEKLRSQSGITVRSSEQSDRYMSLFSDFHPSTPITETLSKSDSNLQNINTRRGSDGLSDRKFRNIPSLKEPTLSLVVSNGNVKEKSNRKEDRNKLLSNISFRSDTSKYTNMNKANEIHLKFEAEVHLLNDFNESLRHFSEVEKAFNTLKSQNDILATTNKVLQNQDTQTSIVTKSSTPSTESKTDDCISDEKSELSSINFSQNFLVDLDSSSLNVNNTISKLDDTSNVEDLLNRSISNNLSNFENLQSNNFAGMTLRMFEQLIKDEDVRLENLKTILKIREQALLDRTKGELAWLEIQRKHLRETGKLHEASLIKKKQRGILVNHQKERHEMQRLKQMQKAASTERKIILKEQRNLIKHQLSTDKMLSKIKVNGPRERRLSGPLKVIQSQAESIKSETSFSRKSSSDRERETFSISHTQSIVSIVSEVTDEASRRDALPRPDLTDLTVRLPSEATTVPFSQMKRTLLIREAALQKRRKAAEDLLQWHRKLLEEEKRITELETITNTIISQIPSSNAGTAEKYQFKGKQLNQLWLNLTGRDEKKFNETKTYPMSQMALERFCKSAREYSAKTRSLKRGSDSEISDNATENVSRSVESNRNETNEYTSDFDIDSLRDIVNAGDMYVVDESINQLIDNFSRIQDDISSLGKQSLKSEESVNTDSDVDVSVIETARTSTEKQEDLKTRRSDKTTELRKERTLSKKHGNDSKSKSELPETKTEEENRTSDDKISSIIEENVLGIEDNLNKSQEILEELDCVEYQPGKDTSFDREVATEDVYIVSEGKANLNRSEEILQRLSLTDDKDSINSDKNVTKTSLSDEINKSESILLQLRPLEDKSGVEASTSPVLSEDTKDTNSIDVKTAEDTSLSEKSSVIEENLKNEDISLVNEEILVPSSEIISEKPLEIEEPTEETKEEPTSKSAINNTSEVPNEASSIIEDNSAASLDLGSEKDEIQTENEWRSVSTNSVLPSKTSGLEGETDLTHEDQAEEQPEINNKIIDSPQDEISEKISESCEDTNKKPDSDQISLKEDSESKITSCEDSVSGTNKIVEDNEEISVQNEESLTSNQAPTIAEDKTSPDENTESKSVVSENISVVKSEPPQTILFTDKSVSENQATILSKEDINSYEEKELDSLSSSTTASQTSVVNDKEENHSEEIKSKASEDKSSRSETVDVKKRVSEIMADASQASRGDKSPKLQDFYTTTYDLVSPANSPELGSPVEEQKLVSPKSIFGTEAEEILRKQLAIEQEIKQITEQQQKEQIPYLYVREIPNKPPPPYTPPSSAPATNVVTIIPTSEEIEEITKYSAKILHKAYVSNNLDNVSISNNTLSLISKDITKECYKFVFDLCKDISKEHYRQFEQEECVAWLKEKKNSRLAVQKPLDVSGLEKHMTKKLKELFGYEKPMRRENAIIKWSRKKRDHVDEILVMESQAEESKWTSYEKDELLVMNDVTNEIMNMLLKETTEVFSKILSKQTF